MSHRVTCLSDADCLQTECCAHFTFNVIKVLCREQEDTRHTIGTMVNQSWAHCDPFSQKAELPACKCEESWTASAHACHDGSGVETTFRGCPTIAQISQCQGSSKYAGAEQTWCDTTYARYGGDFDIPPSRVDLTRLRFRTATRAMRPSALVPFVC